MTADEIRALQPGVELDRLVAEKVLGWHNIEVCHAGTIKTGHTVLIGSPPGTFKQMGLGDYSSSMYWAWDLVEKLSPLGLIRIERSPERGLWFASFCWNYGKGGAKSAEAETAPLAICRAALLSVESAQPRPGERNPA